MHFLREIWRMLNEARGYVTFCLITFVGYTLAAFVLSKFYPAPKRNPVIVGSVRTLIGMTVGLVFFYVVKPLSPGGSTSLELLILFFARVGEWWFLMWLFYRSSLGKRSRDW